MFKRHADDLIDILFPDTPTLPDCLDMIQGFRPFAELRDGVLRVHLRDCSKLEDFPNEDGVIIIRNVHRRWMIAGLRISLNSDIQTLSELGSVWNIIRHRVSFLPVSARLVIWWGTRKMKV